MPIAVQEFVAQLTIKAAADLEKILLCLPEDKRTWTPDDKTRSALDQVAEVALLTGTTADMIRTKGWPEGYSFETYFVEKSALAQDMEKTLAILHENTPKAVEAIRAATDESLEIVIQMPWGPMTIAQIIVYPYWNMTYHEGQINYITALLGCQP